MANLSKFFLLLSDFLQGVSTHNLSFPGRRLSPEIPPLSGHRFDVLAIGNSLKLNAGLGMIDSDGCGIPGVTFCAVSADLGKPNHRALSLLTN